MSIASDCKHVLAPAIEQCFRDKDTALPLANGRVYFWRDVARTEPKPVFELTGTPNNYEFVELPNPVELNSKGTFDTAIYYNPFTEEGDVDLYFIEVWSAPGKPTGVLQETRQGYPDVCADDSGDLTYADNYIPNGQFVAHYDVGTAVNQITPLAWGGHSFDIDTAANPGVVESDVEFSFEAINLEGNPDGINTFALRIDNNSNANELFKTYLIIFKDVNQFSSDDDIYTFQFEASSNTAGDVPVSFTLFKNYGVGGSPSFIPTIANFIITPGYNKYLASFVFESNAGKIIGDNSYVALEVRFPINSVWSVSITNSMLVKGEFTNLDYPITTVRQHKKSISDQIDIPIIDANDISLGTGDVGKFLTVGVGDIVTDPVITFSDGPIKPGMFSWYGAETPPDGWLFCDGTSFDIDPDTNPNLQNLFGVIGYNFGVGSEYLSFWGENNAIVRFIADTNGVPAFALSTGTSGFIFTLLDPGTAGSPMTVDIEVLPGNAITPGSYFLLDHPSFVDTVVWFNVDGAGTEPNFGTAPFYDEIQVLSTDSALQVRDKVAAHVGYTNYLAPVVLAPPIFKVTNNLVGVANVPDAATSGFTFNIVAVGSTTIQQQVEITPIAAAGISGGDHYILFSGTNREIVTWFTVDGVGDAPDVPGALFVQVDLLSGDSATDVANKIIATPSPQFNLPDLQGRFIRGLNNGTERDPDVLSRWGSGINFTGNRTDSVGSGQVDGVNNFIGGGSSSNAYFEILAQPGGPNLLAPLQTTQIASENRPKNVYLLPIIKT